MGPQGDTSRRVAVLNLGGSDAHDIGYLLSHTAPELRVDVFETSPPIPRDVLLVRYDAVVYAVAPPGERPPSIPGADLPGSITAAALVARLAGEASDDRSDVDLNCRRALVIGDTDRALDVARLLAAEEIVVVAERGPEQASFSPRRLGGLDALADAEVVADAVEVAVPAAYREHAPDATVPGRLALLQEYAGRPRRGARRRIALRFLLSPTRIVGQDRVEAVELVRNTLERDQDCLMARPTAARAIIPAGLVVWAPPRAWPALPGIRPDAHEGLAVDEHSRIIDADGRPTGEYVSDATSPVEIARVLLRDLAAASRPDARPHAAAA